MANSSTASPAPIAQDFYFYTWQGFNCAYTQHEPIAATHGLPLVLIHPIGVGLSGRFWDRFTHAWHQAGHQNQIYNPDLLGCGASDKPSVACFPEDWASQLRHFIVEVVQTPAVVLVQGALLPVAIDLAHQLKATELMCGLIMAGPPALSLITRNTPTWSKNLAWNLFSSPLGLALYRYVRREKFLASFSVRQLFATAEQVDQLWLQTLIADAQNTETRYAVYAFLAGFWRQDYSAKLASLPTKTLVVIGEKASSISKEGEAETPDQRLQDYLTRIPDSRGLKIAGRNVLPYESTTEFITAISPFIDSLS